MKISLLSDIGLKRSSNQDFVGTFLNQKGINLVVLADGMGGHKAGNVASETAVLDLGNQWMSTDLTELVDIRDWLMQAMEAENEKIYQLGQIDDYKGMGTTLEAVAIVGTDILLGHVGDSRIGLVRGDQYQLLTNDHSLVNALVEAGELTPEEAETHPKKNIITQSVGQATPLAPDFAAHALEVGDYLVINSDGLTNMISNEDIIAILQQDISLDDKCQALISLANEHGGLDNITVALVAFESEDQA